MGGEPVRSCLVCRRRAPKRTLVRLAVTAGALTVDPQARLGGRGGYVCRRGRCIDEALRSRGTKVLRALRTDPQRAVVDAHAVQENWQAVHQDREGK